MTLLTPPELAVEQGPSTTPEQRATDLAMAAAMYAEQEVIAAEVVLAYAALWAVADPSLEPDLFLRGLAAIVDEFSIAARELAARQVNDSRAIVGLPAIPNLAAAAEALDAEARDRTPGQLAVGDARFQVLRRVDRRRPIAPRARDLAFVQGEAIAEKRVLDAGRHVVTDLAQDRWLAEELRRPAFDRQILGWYRLTDGNPCHFCAMLAGRGAIYSTRYTAGVTVHENQGLDGGYNAAWHPNCRCVAKPLYSTDLDVPDLNLELRELWDDTRRIRAASGLPTDPTSMRRAYRRAIEERSRRLAAESGEDSPSAGE